MTRRRRVALPGLDRPALLWGRSAPRRAVVALSGASDGSADQPMFEHLASVAAPEGCAVLTYDRRQRPAGDVPLADQAEDALTAVRWLRQEHGVSVGLFGFSQGAWVAALAASLAPRDVSHLVLVGCSGVSPAQQMRFHVDETLRRAGHGGAARRSAAALRAAYEDVQRGTGDRSATQRLLDRASEEPWFALAWLPRELPAAGSWGDLDFDPGPVFAGVRCPVRLVYGEDEDTVPVADSVAAWRSAGQRPEVAVLPGWGHFPTRPGGTAIDEQYSGVVADWLRRTIAT